MRQFFACEMDRNLKDGGIIGHGDSYLDFTFCHSEVCRLHGKLHVAAEAVQSQPGKGPGYCYTIIRG